MIENRLRKNLKNTKKWLNKNEITAYRLYNKDIPEFPYLIDVYNDYFIVYEKGKKLEDTEESVQLRKEKQAEINLALKNIFETSEEKIIYKKRQIQDNQNTQYKKENDRTQLVQVNEEGRLYYVNLYDYLDTGLFLDHRWLRRKVQSESESKRCLNLYCYTGAISIALEKGNALDVVSVDLSNTYINWTKDNYELNRIPCSEENFVRADVFSYLKEDQEYFDLIVCDPPTFSNSKKLSSEFDVQRDHIGLINLCMKNLKRDGKLYFSNNLRKFKMSEEIKDKFIVKDISKNSFDKDFNQNTKRHLFEITFRDEY